MKHTQYWSNISLTQIPPCCFSFSHVIKNLTKLKQYNVLQIPSGKKKQNHTNTKNRNFENKKVHFNLLMKVLFHFYTIHHVLFKYKWQMTGNITFHLYFAITQCFPPLSVRQFLQMDERLNRDFSCTLQLNEYLMHDIRIVHSFQMFQG